MYDKIHAEGKPLKLIYSVEDDASIGALTAYTLTSAGYEVMSFTSAESMLTAMEQRLPSLILLDLMLPGMDGITALRLIRDKYKGLNVKIILLTAKSSEIDKVSGLNVGADDYVTKPFSVLELTARVRAHLRGYSATLADGRMVFGGIEIDLRRREVTAGGKAVALTFTEFELLKILAQNAGTVLDRERLVREIWGEEYFGESRTVDIHIKNLRGKLGEYGRSIVSSRGVGYILTESGR
jgi:two-component system alkaline phosphatase synthesis response regulator PhoP